MLATSLSNLYNHTYTDKNDRASSGIVCVSFVTCVHNTTSIIRFHPKPIQLFVNNDHFTQNNHKLLTYLCKRSQV